MTFEELKHNFEKVMNLESLKAAITGTTGFVASVATTQAVELETVHLSAISTAFVQVVIGVLTIIGIVKGWRNPKQP